MNQDDIRALVRGVAPVVADLVSEAVRPLLDRIAGLERQLAEQPSRRTWENGVRRMIADAMPPPVNTRDLLAQLAPQIERCAGAAATFAAQAEISSLPPPAGKDADPAEIERQVRAVVAELAPTLKGEPGTDVTVDQVRELVAAEVAQLPPPAAGKDADPEAIEHQVRAVIAELAPTLKGEPGTDVTMDQVQEWISAELALWPKPQDGKSVDPAEVTAMVKSAVEALPRPADGVGLASALIDRDGELVLTLTNGDTRALGRVVGEDADPKEIHRQVAAAVEAIPKPRDGVDGFGLEDFGIEQKDDGRTVELRFRRADLQKTFELEFPVVIDRGVWREGGYAKGDAVTWGGGLWIAQKGTQAKPAEGDDWRLAVRRGRDGKDLTPPAARSTAPIAVGVPGPKPAGAE